MSNENHVFFNKIYLSFSTQREYATMRNAMKDRRTRNEQELPPPKTVVVAINLGDTSGRKSFAGVLRFVDSGRRWQLKVINDFSRFDAEYVHTARANGIDGIIAGYPEAKNCFRELLVDSLPVAFNVLPERFPVPPEKIRQTAFADIDNRAIARAAAEHLAFRGNFRSVAFVTDRAERRWSTEREYTFAEAWTRRGLPLRVYSCRSEDRPMDGDDLGRFLMNLPKPAAVWCVYDVTAATVAEVCARHHLGVPNQIAILGVDNDEVLCRFTSPNLSSVAVDHEELGYRAAEALDRMMSGRQPPKKPQIVGSTGIQVVERDSTRRIPPASHLVARALKYITANAAKGIDVNDVVAHLGVSRTLADLRFRQIQKKSIGRTIIEARLAEVKTQLRHSDSSFAQIASTCAFSSFARLAHFFKKETGMTMSEYRDGRTTRRP